MIEEDEQERLSVIQALMQHAGGRRFLWWLLQVGKAINNQPFASNALVMSFGCGEQQVGNQILAEIINADADGFADLMKEMNRDRRERDNRLAAAREQ